MPSRPVAGRAVAFGRRSGGVTNGVRPEVSGVPEVSEASEVYKAFTRGATDGISVLERDARYPAPMPPIETSFTVNGRTYTPGRCAYAVACLDGCAVEYLDEALDRGRAPHLARMLSRGRRCLARGVIPSFTNPNNASIVTGVPPAIHGITGNFFLDRETGEEVMCNDARFLKCGTIVAEAARAGRRVAVVTAKDKLRAILSKDLDGIGFSAEKARDTARETHGVGDVEWLVGRAQPEIYSADASLYVLDAGVALVERGLADLLYLSLTDYVQHKFAPDEAEALDFIAGIDARLGRLAELGVVLGITADHGMNAKHDADGRPRVAFLEAALDDALGAGQRVICPITDPYVAHHGSLGSAVVVHLTDPGLIPQARERLMSIPGVTEVLTRGEAERVLELDTERLGDLIVLADRATVLGSRPERHDTSELDRPLRSHGGRYEEMVPFLLSEPPGALHEARLRGDVRNFDIFEFTLNATGVPTTASVAP